LNPLRLGLIKDLNGLEKYVYCSHGTILGTHIHPWQARDGVLAQFGRRESEAREAYQQFVSEGIRLGRRPELSSVFLEKRTHKRYGNIARTKPRVMPNGSWPQGERRTVYRSLTYEAGAGAADFRR